MREFSTPLTIEIPATGNLTDDVVTNAREAADAVVFSRKVDGEWTDVTAAEFLAEVSAVAKGLMAAGIEPGDRVALISKTRYEWTLLDYAIWFAGAATVPVYETSSAEQIGWILADSGAKAVVAEGKEHLARVSEARQSGAGDDLNHVWSIDDNAVGVLGRLGPGHLRRGPRGASYVGHAPRPRHADLHQRDDRPPQGLHAHPRQLHVRAGRRDRRAAPPLRHRGRLDAALPAAGPRLRPDHPGRRRQEAGPPRPQRRHQEPPGRPRGLPADVHPGRPPRLREGLQQRLPARHGRRPRQDLRPRRRDRHRLVARPGRRPRAAAGQGAARPLRQAGLRQAAHRARRQLPVRRLRRRAARRPARPLLPRHRRDRARGLRPDRDHGRA